MYAYKLVMANINEILLSDNKIKNQHEILEERQNLNIEKKKKGKVLGICSYMKWTIKHSKAANIS